MKVTELARKLAPLVGKPLEGKGFNHFRSHLGMMLNGERPFPPEWLPHLISILECSNEIGLVKFFPKIRTRDCDTVIPIKVELVVTSSIGTVPENELPKLIQLVREFVKFGIVAEIHINVTESPTAT